MLGDNIVDQTVLRDRYESHKRVWESVPEGSKAHIETALEISGQGLKELTFREGFDLALVEVLQLIDALLANRMNALHLRNVVAWMHSRNFMLVAERFLLLMGPTENEKIN